MHHGLLGFQGIYQDHLNFRAQFAVEPESYLNLYPEYALADAEREAFLATRTGAIAGRALADRFGWQIGDRIPLQGTFFKPRDGGAWEFTLEGIYDGAEEHTDTTQFFFHHEYLAENNAAGRGFVNYYIIRVDDPARAVEIGQAVDARFANSPAETKTLTEQAFAQAFANQVGDIGTIMIAILVVVLFTILLVTVNTMVHSIRERTSELAVLKTLGFSNRRVMALVLFESCLLAVLGGGLGLGLGYVLVGLGDPTGGFLTAFFIPPRDLVLGSVLAVALGLVSGILPSARATRLRIVDALRKV